MFRATLLIPVCVGLVSLSLSGGERLKRAMQPKTRSVPFFSTQTQIPPSEQNEDDLLRRMGIDRLPPAGVAPQTNQTPTAPAAPTDPVPNLPNFSALGNPNYAAIGVGGYLDVAAPVTQIRMRFDDALNSNFPDRGEYFYAACGCFKDYGLDPNATGPGGLNNSVNYRAIRSYMEYAFSSRFSVFAELPVEWVHYNTNANDNTNNPGAMPQTFSPVNSGGLSDVNAGFKYALIANPDQYLTFQLRAYLPTGNSSQGLGTDHVSLESGLLYYRQLSSRWILQAEVKEFAPIDVTSFASNVLQYGSGLGYRVWGNEHMAVTPTIEMVGWTFLGGKKFNPIDGFSSASGDTIINVKPGVRVGFGEANLPAGQQRHSLYFGWGHAITNDRLYQDIYRLEYRLLF